MAPTRHPSRHHGGVGAALRLARRSAGLARRRPRRGRGRGRVARRTAARSPRRPSSLVFTRWVLVMTGFERELYANPEADLDRGLVGPRRPSSARHSAGRTERAGLGGEDPRRDRARLLPHVSLRLDRRAAAARHAPSRGGRHRRTAGSRPPARRAALRTRARRIAGTRLVERASGSPLSVDSLAREVAAASPA